MKLIDILARDLKEWPKEFDHALLTQSVSGQVEYVINNRLMWAHDRLFQQADDWKEGIVDKEDWEAGRRAATTPTLETMLTEWRDLEARAQAAQAEADALFEHAGQCHGEIVVRLAELGWGAPRGPMVPGEPVVTLDTSLDMTDWRNWQVGDLVRVLDDEGYIDFEVGGDYRIYKIDNGSTHLPIQLKDHTCAWLDLDHMLWISRPSAQQ